MERHHHGRMQIGCWSPKRNKLYPLPRKAQPPGISSTTTFTSDSTIWEKETKSEMVVSRIREESGRGPGGFMENLDRGWGGAGSPSLIVESPICLLPGAHLLTGL